MFEVETASPGSGHRDLVFAQFDMEEAHELLAAVHAPLHQTALWSPPVATNKSIGYLCYSRAESPRIRARCGCESSWNAGPQ